MNKQIVIIGILIIIIICLIKIILLEIKQTKYENKLFYKILLNDCLTTVKSGDLILFSDHIKVPINIIIGNNKFSHTGIVIVLNNKPYIYEIVDTTFGYNTHMDMKKFNKYIQLTPLYERVKYYAGNCYLTSLNKLLSNRQLNLLTNFINTSKDYKFINFKKWFPFMLTSMIIPKQRFCHEFIADILDKIEISSEPIKQSKVFITNKLIELCDGNIYSNPVHIIPNDLIINKNVDINKLPILNYSNRYIKTQDINNNEKYLKK